MRAFWMERFFLVILALAVLVPEGAAQDRKQLFVDEVRFQGFPKAWEDRFQSWGMGLAMVVSGALNQSSTHLPMTMANLKSQLGKEKIKETLACADASCVNRMVENFGLSESLFGMVVYVSESKALVTLTHTADGEKVGEVGPAQAAPDFDSLSAILSGLAAQLFGVTAGAGDGAGSGEVSYGVQADRGETIVNRITDESGFLVIETEPSGATILVNGQEVGRSPKQLDQMVGRYVVVAEMGALWHSARQEVALSTAGAKVRLKLAPAFGTLRVDVTPQDAEIWIGGERMGKGHYENPRKPSGRYAIRVERENYLSFNEEVVVEDGGTVERQVRLEANFGSLKVTSTPPGGAISLNGQVTREVTPHEFKVLEPGVYVVTLEMEGYGDGVGQANVEKGGAGTVDIPLQAKLGLLSVMSAYEDGEPCEGKLSVDGELRGTTPTKVELTAQEHEVRVVCEKGEQQKRVRIEHNKKLTLNLEVQVPEMKVVPVAVVLERKGVEIQEKETGERETEIDLVQVREILRKSSGDGVIDSSDWGARVGFEVDTNPRGFKPGMVIEKANWRTVEDIIPHPLKLLIANYGLRMRTRSYEAVHPSKGYVWATNKFKDLAKTRQGGNDPRRRGLEGYVAGLPFPAPGSGLEIAWNSHYAHRGDDSIASYRVYWIDADRGVERWQEWVWEQLHRALSRTDLKPRPSYKSLKEKGIRCLAMWRAIQPYDQRGFGAVLKGYLEPRDLESWSYMPGSKRAVQMRIGSSGESWNSSDMLYEDMWGYLGYPEWMDWKVLAAKTLLAPMHAGIPTGSSDHSQVVDFEEAPHWNPLLDWEPRSVYVVEARPKHETSPYSRMTFYFDAETYFVLMKVGYDHSGRLSKIVLNGYNGSTDMDRFPPVLALSLYIDLQKQHATAFIARSIKVNVGLQPSSFTKEAVLEKGR